jgi:hypothetical protein
MHNFFLGPQSQFRNLKEVLPQFRNFLKNVGPQLQFRNRVFAIFIDFFSLYLFIDIFLFTIKRRHI